jgi:hypothetical protein
LGIFLLSPSAYIHVNEKEPRPMLRLFDPYVLKRMTLRQPASAASGGTRDGVRQACIGAAHSLCTLIATTTVRVGGHPIPQFLLRQLQGHRGSSQTFFCFLNSLESLI